MNRKDEAHIIKAAINSMATIYDMLSCVDLGDHAIRPEMADVVARLRNRLKYLEVPE